MVLDVRLATEDPAGVSSYLIRRGGRWSVTKQAVPYRLVQPIVGEKFGLRIVKGEELSRIRLRAERLRRDKKAQRRQGATFGRAGKEGEEVRSVKEVPAQFRAESRN